MKKTIGILVAAILLSTVFGCTPKPPGLADRVGNGSNPPVEGEDLTTYTGVIEPFQISLYQGGTHQIKLENGETVVIQSPTINLGNYLGKKVVAKGSLRKLPHNTEEVFTVVEVRLADGESRESGDYESRKWGFGFSYPKEWMVSETTSGVSLEKGDDEVVRGTVFNLDTTLDEFVASHEVEDGAAVTIGGARSLRYTAGPKVWVYIPNVSKKKVVEVEFLGEEGDQEAFYALLESFKLIEGKTAVGDKCAGIDNLACTAGFRCELLSGDENAEGVCRAVDEAGSAQDCPFVPKPTDCTDYQPKALSKNGCPISYVCATESEGAGIQPQAEAPNSAASIDAVLLAFKNAQSGLLPPGAVVQQFEIMEGQGYLAVIFTLDGKKRKILYSYMTTGSGSDFQKLVAYNEGSSRDWVVAEGKEVKITVDRKVINVGAEATAPKIVGKDMRLYENFMKGFSIQYPKDWYYRSFGAINGRIWAVGFSDKPFEAYADSVITVVVAKDKGVAKKSVVADLYRIESPRDEASHFVIEGPLGMRDTLDRMAETLAQN